MPGGSVSAAELETLDRRTGDEFGYSVDVSGTTVVVGAPFNDIEQDFGSPVSNQGSFSFFYDIDSAIGTTSPGLSSTLSDALANYWTGYSIALDGSTAVIGAPKQASTYGLVRVLRGVGAGGGLPHLTLAPTDPDSQGSLGFGTTVGLSGDIVVVGTSRDRVTTSYQGSVHVYRNVQVATGTVYEDAVLIASDAVALDRLGASVAIDGSTAIAGAPDASNDQGAAYVFRNLDSAAGNVTESAKLVGASGFGAAVAISGHTGLVGAETDTISATAQGSVHVYRNLDTASGTMTEDLKLIASDPDVADFMGKALALSSNVALVGVPDADIGPSGSNHGAAYLFLDVNSGTGTVTEDVKIHASEVYNQDGFGNSVAIDGDRFVVGSARNDDARGSAYSGTVSSMTTLDVGGTMRRIDGISFDSRTDWVIGDTTSGNTVVLEAGDSAQVTASGKLVYIGKGAGSNNNRLIVNGHLTAGGIQVGAAGNSGNELIIGPSGSVVGSMSFGQGTVVGGSGTIQGDLTLGSGAGLAFTGQDTLMVTGEVELDPTFGVDDLAGLDSTVPGGSYPLIDGTATSFGELGIENWGVENAADLGDGKIAYFSEGSLILNVVEVVDPEIVVEGSAATPLTSGAGEVDFGCSVPGAMGASMTFVVRNEGTGDLTGLLVDITGASAASFAADVALLPDTLAAGGSASFTITFSPSSLGDHTASIELSSNDTDENPFVIVLAGTGETAQAIFDEVVASAGLVEEDALEAAEPFGDGVSNLLKYAFNMDLSGPDRSNMPPDGTSGLPQGRLVEVEGQSYWRVEFVRRKGSGLIYQPMKSDDLSTGFSLPFSASPVSSSIDSKWERVIYDEPIPPGATRSFSRIKVELP